MVESCRDWMNQKSVFFFSRADQQRKKTQDEKTCTHALTPHFTHDTTQRTPSSCSSAVVVKIQNIQKCTVEKKPHPLASPALPDTSNRNNSTHQHTHHQKVWNLPCRHKLPTTTTKTATNKVTATKAPYLHSDHQQRIKEHRETPIPPRITRQQH